MSACAEGKILPGVVSPVFRTLKWEKPHLVKWSLLRSAWYRGPLFQGLNLETVRMQGEQWGFGINFTNWFEPTSQSLPWRQVGRQANPGHSMRLPPAGCTRSSCLSKAAAFSSEKQGCCHSRNKLVKWDAILAQPRFYLAFLHHSGQWARDKSATTALGHIREAI